VPVIVYPAGTSVSKTFLTYCSSRFKSDESVRAVISQIFTWRSFAYQIGAEHNNLRNYVLRKTTIGVVSDYSSFVFSV